VEREAEAIPVRVGHACLLGGDLQPQEPTAAEIHECVARKTHGHRLDGGADGEKRMRWIERQGIGGARRAALPGSNSPCRLRTARGARGGPKRGVVEVGSATVATVTVRYWVHPEPTIIIQFIGENLSIVRGSRFVVAIGTADRIARGSPGT